MKNLKRFTAMIMATIMILFSIVALFNKSKAIIIVDGVEYDLVNNHIPPIYGQAENEYEFNAQEILCSYAELSTGGKDLVYKFERENTDDLVLISSYDDNGNLKDINGNDKGTCVFDRGTLDAKTASTIIAIALNTIDPEEFDEDELEIVKNLSTRAGLDRVFKENVDEIKKSLAKHLNVDKDDVTVYVTVKYPRISGITDKLTNDQLTINVNTKNGVTDQIYQRALQFRKYNRDTALKMKDVALDYTDEELIRNFLIVQQKISVKAVGKTPEQTYSMVIGKDKKFYLENTVPADAIGEFATKLDYSAKTEDKKTIEGKMSSDGKTFLPPYYDDDVNKTDADAIATITSKTSENIVKINGIEVKPDGTPNSERWYYPDPKNKKVVSREYLFKTYDNEEDHGYVSELVKVEGEKGGLSTEEVSIKWTFRRKVVETKENEDKSVTVTITYNLPIDVASIPEGWSPIYDKGNSGACHKITKTIKQGENYDKDLTVKQKGTDETNTTHVKKIWETPKEEDKKEEQKPSNLPQGGESHIIIGVIAAVAGIAFVARRKLK